MQIGILQGSKAKIKQNSLNEKNKLKQKEMIKGVLLDNHIKNNEKEFSFSNMEDSLLICDKYGETDIPDKARNQKSESAFNTKKALTPLLIGTGVILGGSFALSEVVKNSSKTILKSKSFEQLPDLAVNMNIKEEPQFAIYRAIREPSSRNILGAIGVFIMGGITIAAKSFIDGAKEIWLKKKSADIEKELQENLISVETGEFSGKLKVINEIAEKNIKYFDSVLNKKEVINEQPPIFAQFPSFKGAKKQTGENNDKEKNNEKLKNFGFVALTAGITAGAFILGKLSLSNLRKTVENCNTFANNITESTIDTIKTMGEKADKNDIPRLTEYFKSICAKPEFIKEITKKYNLSEIETNGIINAVEETKKTIFADAPTALGGIPKKIQYYCYIDENRGHLYNWILNPENKFTRYLFTAFTASTAVEYLFKQGIDATKELAVMKENAKTELDLRKRLVDTEIRNFKAKKESAINPLMENFRNKLNSGERTKEELKELADNILSETKNGPPYVYN